MISDDDFYLGKSHYCQCSYFGDLQVFYFKLTVYSHIVIDK